MAVNPRAARGRATERLRMTVEEYLAFEAMSQEKHEYVDSWVYPLYPDVNGMASGTNNHAALTSNVAAALHVALRHSPCIVYSPSPRVQVDATAYRIDRRASHLSWLDSASGHVAGRATATR